MPRHRRRLGDQHVHPVGANAAARPWITASGDEFKRFVDVGVDATDEGALFLDAYLIVVSCIIEALVHGDERPSTSDLINFSKALAEQRRLDISRLEIERRFPEKVSSNDTLTATKDKPLPGGFSEVVEQIYGTNVTGV